MTQQPFSRPGAIDLSGLKAARRPPAHAAGAGGAGAAGGAGGAASAYSVDVTEQNFQATVEASMTAPVLLVFFSRTRMPESAQLADDLETAVRGVRGPVPRRPGRHRRRRRRSRRRCRSRRSRWSWPSSTAGRCRCSRTSSRWRSCAPPLTQVMQQLTTQGITGRHQPRTARRRRPRATRPRSRPSTRATPPPRTRWARATSTRAVAEYQKLVDANPADAEAAAGLAMAKVLQRTQGVDLQHGPRGRGRRPRRRRRPDHGRRPRPARRPRRRRVQPAGRAGPAYRRATTATQAREHLLGAVRGRRQRRPARAARPPGPRLGAVLAAAPLGQHRAPGLEPRHRHPERRARDVVEPDVGRRSGSSAGRRRAPRRPRP